MGKRLIAAVAVLAVATGCARVSESRLNPFNWFSASEEAEVSSLLPPEARSAGPQDSSTPVPDVVSMQVDRMPGGAVVTAEGVTLTQGFWESRLVEVPRGLDTPSDAIVLDFRVQRPYRPHPVGAVPTRTVSAGIYLSEADLRGISQIIVRGSITQRVARR